MNSTENIIQCPHCQQYIVILELNCKIFRHGTYKTTGEQIPPHSPKDICDKLVETDQIYGCGKPFRIVILENENNEEKNQWLIEKCEYI
jgi:hypothetical protein